MGMFSWYEFKFVRYRHQATMKTWQHASTFLYRGVDKSLARPTSRYILSDDENIYFDASLVIYINSTTIPPIMIINRIY
jgi:homoserine trans-succinylase